KAQPETGVGNDLVVPGQIHPDAGFQIGHRELSVRVAGVSQASVEGEEFADSVGIMKLPTDIVGKLGPEISHEKDLADIQRKVIGARREGRNSRKPGTRIRVRTRGA